MNLDKRKNGLLYDIQQYILKNSWIPQPELAVSASLCTIATLINRKITFLNNVPNLYCLNIAPSGAGKDAPQQAAKNVILQLGLNNMLGAGDYVSDASLMNTLEVQPVRLDVIDEAAGFLQKATGTSSDYATKIDDILCELYTSSNSYYAGRQLADSRKGECLRPCVNLLMSTTPRGLEQGLSRKSVDKGLLGRNLLFYGDKMIDSRIPETKFNLPLSVKNALLAISQFDPGTCPESERRYFGDGLYHDIAIAQEENRDKLLELQRKYDKLRQAESDDSFLTPIIARGFQMICKISLVNAVARNPESLPPVITQTDLDFAEQIVDNNIRRFKDALGKHVFENHHDKKYNTVREIIKEAGSITMSDLGRKLRGITARDRKQILADLLEFKLIEMKHKKLKSGNKATTYYVWTGEDDE